MADKNLRLQVILEGLDRVTAPLKAITGASSSARRDLAETQKQLRALDAVQQQVGRYKMAEGRYASDLKELPEAQAKVAALKKQLEATENPTKKLRAEFEKAERQAAQLASRLDAGGNELQQLSAKLTEAGVDVADLARHEDRLANQVYDANKALKAQETQLEKVATANRNSQKLRDISGSATTAGLGMMAAGTAAAAPLYIATQQAMTLESAMADVRKVVDFPTPDAFAKMSNDILDMSTRIPMAADGIAQIVAAAGRANVPREELLAFAEDAAKMGVAFDSTAEVAGETMAKWRTAFELPQQGVRDLADQINALTNTYGGNVGAVTEMVTRIGPLGKVGGLAAGEIAAMGQVLSSVGVESEIGATGIKNLMLALTKGEAATKSQNKAFEALGLNATDVAKAMQKDAGGAILDVMNRLRALPKEAQAGALTQLFGSESVAAIAPMLTSLDQLKTNFGMVGDKSQYAGSMTKEYLAASGTTQAKTDLAKNSLNALSTEMGEKLLPNVSDLSEKFTEVANGMRDWASENPNLAKGIMVFMAVGSGLLIFLGMLAMAFAALTFAAAPLGIALLPLLAIVAAVALLAAGVYLIYDNWGAMVDWFTGIGQKISDAVGSAIDWIVNAWNSLDMMAIGRNIIQGLINGLTGMLGTLKSSVMNIASSVANWFKEKLGIHSPSRVFAGLGGYVMEGLDQGLAQNTSGPLSRITDLSGQMTRALAVGAGGVALAAATPAAAQSAGATGAPANAPVSTTYHININAGAGAQAQDIAEEVRKAIEAIERERRGRGFGDD